MNDATPLCTLLIVLQVLECTVEKGYAWMSHMQGVARLVQLRGPERHNVTEQGHRLFLGLRELQVRVTRCKLQHTLGNPFPDNQRHRIEETQFLSRGKLVDNTMEGQEEEY